jgi:hypothetical protein
MAETILRGPGCSLGSMIDGRVELFDGPEIHYQAGAIPDPRYSPVPKDGLSPGRVRTFFNTPYVVMADNIPSASSTTAPAIATGVVATALVAIPLATAQLAGSAAGVPSASPAIPIIPFGAANTTTVLALDFGFATGTTTNNSTTVVVQDSSKFSPGTWYVFGGAGNSSASAPLIAQAISIVNATTITISQKAGTGLSNIPIGAANQLFTGFVAQLANQAPPAANAAFPFVLGGLAALFNPLEALTRNVTVTGTTGATAQFLVTGYDIYGQLMTELITSSGTTTVGGKKAFKYIQSVVPQQSQAAGSTFNVGVGDTFGINLRSDFWEYLNVFWNGGFMAANNGWTAAVLTSPATNTTGDVRGTLNVSAFTSPITGTANGVRRLTIMGSVPLFNMINATPLNSSSLFGVTQA